MRKLMDEYDKITEPKDVAVMGSLQTAVREISAYVEKKGAKLNPLSALVIEDIITRNLRREP